AVRGGARLLLAHRVGDAREVLLLHRVEQLEAHLVAAVGALRDRAEHQRVGEARAPLGVVDRRGLGGRRRERRQLEPAEQAAPLEVRAHDLREARRQRALAGEADHRDRDALAAGAGDLDRELRVREGHGEQRNERTEAKYRDATEQVRQTLLFLTEPIIATGPRAGLSWPGYASPTVGLSGGT